MIEMSLRRSVGPPGVGAGLPSATSLPPMIANVGHLDVQPLGDVDVRAAHSENTVSSTTSSASSASLRSRSAPPMMFSDRHCLATRHQPLRSVPPMIEMRCLVPGSPTALDGRPRVAGRRDGHGDVAHELLQLPARARRVGGVQALVELLDREPALAGRVAQLVGGALALRVGRAQLRVLRLRHAPEAIGHLGAERERRRRARSGRRSRTGPGRTSSPAGGAGSRPMCW